VKLQARWIGPPPRIGDYLMSQLRPRYAYRIDRMTSAFPSVHWDAAAKAEVHLLRIVAERVAKDDVPPHARVHPWKWDQREAKFSLERRRA
jgi:hypothetical protein